MIEASDCSPQKVVARVHAAWAAAFGRRDAAALAALYTADTALYGSVARLYRGRAGVQEYFAALPARFRRARFGVPALVSPVPHVVVASGPVWFDVEDAGVATALPYRMTHVLAEVGGHWLIATHHASPEP